MRGSEGTCENERLQMMGGYEGRGMRDSRPCAREWWIGTGGFGVRYGGLRMSQVLGEVGAVICVGHVRAR